MIHPLSQWGQKIMMNGFTASRMSRTGGRDIMVACAIVESPWRHKHVTFVDLDFLPSRPITPSSVQAQIGSLWGTFAHLDTGCGINAKDNLGAGFILMNPAPMRPMSHRAKTLADFSCHLSGGFDDLNPAPPGIHYRIEERIIGTAPLWSKSPWIEWFNKHLHLGLFWKFHCALWVQWWVCRLICELSTASSRPAYIVMWHLAHVLRLFNTRSDDANIIMIDT